MMLLDTNVLIYASDTRSVHCRWARQTIAEAVAGEGAAVNAVTLAELCVGDAEPSTVADRVRGWGVEALDIPSAVAEITARAFVSYRNRRKRSTDRDVPSIPLPDFFIGAHAQVMGWILATADQDRYKTYFPKVRLKSPPA
jgi:predicted nucleic acid-binding protein